MVVFVICSYHIEARPSSIYCAPGDRGISLYDDIVLRHPSGRILVPPSVDFVCFNDIYVMGTRYGPAHSSRGFIYRKGDAEAVFGGERFDQMEKESGLCEERGSRPADEATWTGYGILLNNYRLMPVGLPPCCSIY